jgi:hypothetical protein
MCKRKAQASSNNLYEKTGILQGLGSILSLRGRRIKVGLAIATSKDNYDLETSHSPRA